MLNRPVLLLLFVVPFLLAAMPATAITVPNAECPDETPTVMFQGGCSYSWACIRTDSAPTVVYAGTFGHESGAQINCNNCNGACTDPCNGTPPPPMLCTSQLTASYTESVSSHTASSSMVNAAVIALTLENSIGHSNQRTKEWTATCGTEQFPSCKKGAYALSVYFYTNIEKKITHTYQWRLTLTPTSLCGNPTNYAAGATVSTATGNAWTAAACSTIGEIENCS